MYWLELQDIMFLVSCLQNQSDHVIEHFNITDFIQPCTSGTRSSAHSKLKCTTPLSPNNHTSFFYFTQVVKLWNSLAEIDLALSWQTIRYNLKSHLYDHFLANFNPDSTCTWHYLCPCSSCSSINTLSNFAPLWIIYSLILCIHIWLFH